MEKVTADQIRTFIQDQVKLFDKDPADSDYQRGYEKALYDVLAFSNGMLKP